MSSTRTSLIRVIGPVRVRRVGDQDSHAVYQAWSRDGSQRVQVRIPTEDESFAVEHGIIAKVALQYHLREAARLVRRRARQIHSGDARTTP